MIFLLILTWFATWPLTAQAAESIPTSEYTSLEESACKTQPAPKPQVEEDDSFTQTCPGRDGYEITHLGGDLRSWLRMKKGALDFDTMDKITLVPGSFPHVTGTKLEWRYKEGKLLGWIFRMGANQEDKGKNVSKL